MFFDSTLEIEKIAAGVGCGIFVVPKNMDVSIKNAIILAPEEKTIITVEQVREILPRLSAKQQTDFFVIIRPADKLGEEAANALLKSLEEPREKVHFVLITSEPGRLLPTILSRAAVYFLRGAADSFEKVDADAKIITQAKELFAAKPAELAAIAEKLAKTKENAREKTLEILAVAIEILYKTYYKTEKKIYILKISKFLLAYENIAKNGNIKLHLVADLV